MAAGEWQRVADLGGVVTISVVVQSVSLVAALAALIVSLWQSREAARSALRGSQPVAGEAPVLPAGG